MDPEFSRARQKAHAQIVERARHAQHRMGGHVGHHDAFVGVGHEAADLNAPQMFALGRVEASLLVAVARREHQLALECLPDAEALDESGVQKFVPGVSRSLVGAARIGHHRSHAEFAKSLEKRDVKNRRHVVAVARSRSG